jgi:hypothetical protein
MKKTDISRLLTEEVVTLHEAREELQKLTGKRFDKATLWRWATRGAYGTKLDTVRVGRAVMTSRQAITRFIENQNR